MASVFQDSVAQALAEQPWWLRRKDSLVAIAGTVLQVANLAVLVSGDMPAWMNAIVAAVIGAAQIVVHAGTKGAITPSMAQRLEASGEQAHLDLVPTSGIAVTEESEPVTAVVQAELPVYDGGASGYEGQHRLGE